MMVRNSRRPLGVLEHRRLLRELAVQELQEPRALGQLFEALPVPAPEGALQPATHAGELDGHGGNRVRAHRWHVEQEVRVWILYSFTSLAPELELIGRGLVGDVVDLGLRAARSCSGWRWQLEAPLHLQRLLLPDERHLVHATVAGRAAHALVHVGAVVEVDEVGQVVDLRPLDGLRRCGSSRAPAPGSGSGSRSGSGSSCRSWWGGCPRPPTSRPRCGSSGSPRRGRPRGARG